MVSQASIVGMFLSLSLFVIVILLAFLYFYKKSKVVESGYLGAFGLGATAYFWAMVLLMIGSVGLIDSFIIGMDELSNIFRIALVPLLSTFFTVLGCVWANWLTNGKNTSFYRGVAVGLGFGFAETALYYIIPVISNIRHSFEINQGTFYSIMEKSEVSKESIDTIYNNLVETNPFIYFMSGIERIMIVSLYVSILVVLTKYMNEKSLWKGIGFLAILYLVYITGITILSEIVESKWGISGVSLSVIRYVFLAILMVAYAALAKRMYKPDNKIEASYLDEGLL